MCGDYAPGGITKTGVKIIVLFYYDVLEQLKSSILIINKLSNAIFITLVY